MTEENGVKVAEKKWIPNPSLTHHSLAKYVTEHSGIELTPIQAHAVLSFHPRWQKDPARVQEREQEKLERAKQLESTKEERKKAAEARKAAKKEAEEKKAQDELEDDSDLDNIDDEIDDEDAPQPKRRSKATTSAASF